MGKKPINKVLLIALGAAFSAKNVAKTVINQAKESLDSLAKKGKENKPAFDEFVARAEKEGKKLLDEMTKDAKILLDKEARKAQSAFTKEVNRLAKKVAKATNPPRQRSSKKTTEK